jgi:plasmid stability protein
MTSITIRNLDDALKRRLRLRAAEHDRSMEEEARDILRCALAEEPRAVDNLADAMRRLVEPYGGFELPPFPRGPMREPPDFT